MYGNFKRNNREKAGYQCIGMYEVIQQLIQTNHLASKEGKEGKEGNILNCCSRW